MNNLNIKIIIKVIKEYKYMMVIYIINCNKEYKNYIVRYRV